MRRSVYTLVRLVFQMRVTKFDFRIWEIIRIFSNFFPSHTNEFESKTYQAEDSAEENCRDGKN